MKMFINTFWSLVSGACLIAATTSLQAATLLVNNIGDSGPGSLRQAIADNGSLGGGNTIIFSDVFYGAITLTSGELIISNNVTILGPGANVLAVSGNYASRVFLITNAVVTIAGLTITNGFAFSSNGGGILDYSNSTVTVSNCVISGNSSSDGSGGGIYNDSSTLSVIASTLNGNFATYGGGGIFNYNYYDGGNFNHNYGSLTVLDSTISGNSASQGGGIHNEFGQLSVIASTVSGNFGSGIYNTDGAQLKIGDTILKAGASGGNITNVSGTVTSLGYNLSSDAGGGVLDATGDQTNTDPMLGPLQDNGGPTPTMMPLPGSPAIDQGTNLDGLDSDQRGRCRTYDDPSTPNAVGGDGTDIGAVEVCPAHTSIVGTTSDINGPSLRWCLCDAQAGEVITFAPGLTGTITLAHGQLPITKSLTILGPGANALAVDANHASRVFYVDSNLVVTIAGLSIANGFASNAVYASGSTGGGIDNDHSTLTVSNCVLTGNSADIGGGGIYNDGFGYPATLAVIASTLNGNSGAYGGGIDNVGTQGSAVLAVKNSTFYNNSAGTAGGAVFSTGQSGGSASLSVLASTLSNNSAPDGSGIFNSVNSTLTLGDTILQAGLSGATLTNSGGIAVSKGYNLSSDAGGGVLDATGDQFNTDPMLGSLQDNDGPTPTMLPLPGSPAIDQGTNLDSLDSDQRGRCRTYDDPSTPNALGGDGTDIGAVEVCPAQGIVGTTSDINGPSLRWCLCDAQAGDVITFAPGLTGTITLASGQLPVTKSLTILGPGANVLAVSGNQASRVFDVSGGMVNISGLTIRDGRVTGAVGQLQDMLGGGIYCDQPATLSLTGCVISNCAAVGANGLDSTTATGGSAGNGFGGGIYNLGGLTLSNCWVVANEAVGGAGGNSSRMTSGRGGNGGNALGGGIYSASSQEVMIHSSTLSANAAICGAAGVGAGGNGADGTAAAAGLDISGGTVHLDNSTIASNVVTGAGTGAYGGIYSAAGMALLNCTVVGNNGDSLGGGIAGANGGVTNTIVAGNLAGSAPDVSGTFVSGGYNLIGNTNGSSGFGATGDQFNTDPMLGPLQNNDGPTPTMALLLGSPAIDQGKSFGLTTDQRGEPRPFDWPSIANETGGDGSDIGAFELGQPKLNLRQFGTEAVLSWPSYSGNSEFSLQSSTNIALANSWVTVPGTPSVIGNQFFQTNQPISGAKFFRLKSN